VFSETLGNYERFLCPVGKIFNGFLEPFGHVALFCELGMMKRLLSINLIFMNAPRKASVLTAAIVHYFLCMFSFPLLFSVLFVAIVALGQTTYLVVNSNGGSPDPRLLDTPWLVLYYILYIFSVWLGSRFSARYIVKHYRILNRNTVLIFSSLIFIFWGIATMFSQYAQFMRTHNAALDLSTVLTTGIYFIFQILAFVSAGK
jgi:hypothetical protein